MKLRTIASAAFIVILAGALNAATLIIPASGSAPAANNSRWATDLTLHNSGLLPIAAQIAFHDQSGTLPASVTETIAPRSTRSLQDIVRARFGQESDTGALTIDVDDALAGRLSVTSRTYNASENGQLGQDVPAIRSTEALATGDTGVINGPGNLVDFRFNFGLYALEASVVHWQLVRADGTVGAATTVNYGAGVQVQYNGGASSLFASTAQNDDVVYAIVQSGHAMVYGSIIDNHSSDPTFVPGIRTLRDISINFAGVDVNQDGRVDVADADRDGTVDQTVDVFKAVLPNFIRLLATGPNGESVTFSLLDNPPDAVMLDPANGILEVMPSGLNKKGDTETLRVLASTATDSAVLVIPIRYE
jgi:hypothetical protein